MSLDLLVEREGEVVRLCSPDVGLYTCSVARGTALAAGQRAGVLHRLGREVDLIVPPGVAGVVTSEQPEQVLTPVGHGTVLAQVRPMDDAAGLTQVADEQSTAGLVLQAQGSGRYYHRPAPDEPTYVSPGDVLEEGVVVGLIEVMKTFTHVTYLAGGGLPARARVVRALVEDGADVVAGAALLELEEA